MSLDSSEAEVSITEMFEFVKRNVMFNGPVIYVTFVPTQLVQISYFTLLSLTVCFCVPVLPFNFVVPS